MGAETWIFLWCCVKMLLHSPEANDGWLKPFKQQDMVNIIIFIFKCCLLLLLLLLLLSHFSHVRLCATPETAAHQAPRPWDSPGKNTGVGCHFLLQCMKVKSESEVAQSCPTLCDPMDCSLPGSSVHGFSRQEYWSGVPSPSPGDLPDPGIEPRSPALEADALTSEPPGIC